MLIYRSGDDGISWHADDTQAESIILCTVIESQSGPRPVKIRPKIGSGPREDGDEEIELYVDEGDAYEMDGKRIHLWIYPLLFF
jgi:alkylated DNA repair dioxygenase AlkB